MIEYKDIMRSLATEPINQHFPLGCSHSFPIPSKYEDRVIDVFFTYAVVNKPSEKAEFDGPFARIGVIPEENKIAFYRAAVEQPFSANEEEIFFPIPDDPDKVWGAISQYEHLYPHVRDFAYRELITAEEKRVLQKFHDVFQTAVCDCIKQFYQELVPEFFEWLEKNKT